MLGVLEIFYSACRALRLADAEVKGPEEISGAPGKTHGPQRMFSDSRIAGDMAKTGEAIRFRCTLKTTTEGSQHFDSTKQQKHYITAHVHVGQGAKSLRKHLMLCSASM